MVNNMLFWKFETTERYKVKIDENGQGLGLK